jgi:hypothetical protein
MAKRLSGLESGLQAVFLLAAALGALPPALAQDSLISAPDATRAVKTRALPERLADKPSQPPAFTIPVAPLGFAAPAATFLGQRNSFVSLDFLDEDRLLFTFRVPGLIHREAAEREAWGDNERQIRALVLALPAGTVTAEALWKVHDRVRYLWTLPGGRFLLRDRNLLQVGDAALDLKPFLRFPGPLVWLEMDPKCQLLVTDSREPAAAAHQPGETPDSAAALAEDARAAGEPPLAVRILRRDSGKVLLISRSNSIVHLPINSEGYLESLRANGSAWLLKMNDFSGGSAILGQVDSACEPFFDFLSEREVLVTACAAAGAGKLVAMGTDGRRLWEAQTSNTTFWPLLVRAADGSRLAREALALTHAVSARSTLDPDEIKGQLVEVLDAVDGHLALETTAGPVLDAGGNVAISPSGRLVAVLNGGAIQIFELPSPPPLPTLHLSSR